MIVFCELAPKIYAASHAEGVALRSAYIYRVLVLVARPVLWLTNKPGVRVPAPVRRGRARASSSGR